ncbi:MAG TPA: hypothetical protein VNO70_10545 [Blastocatellia bacterium]|nr:hypothetical protein [Blastocatellia bacterium]
MADKPLNRKASKADQPKAAGNLPAVPVRILIVADGEIGFREEDHFNLSLLIAELGANPQGYVNFEIACAHRDDYQEAGVAQNFRFTRESLDGFDQVWLFGIRTAPRQEPFTHLREEEIQALFQFMNAGGGVFATGDHEGLGSGLCGRVPRVRGMRKWYLNDPLPADQLRAAVAYTEFRNDTLRKGPDGFYDKFNEYDDIPKEIAPRMYMVPSYSHVRQYPHPLLDGPRGVIRFLPDHVHEGECVVPAQVTQEMNEAGGEKRPEYPVARDGVRYLPEIIATAQAPEPHVSRYHSALPLTKAGPFGVIAAYDGHRAGVGRTVTDSTFHHFISVNLLGFKDSLDAVSRDRGRQVYDDITAYFRNLAVWLARPQAQQRMFARVLWQAAAKPPIPGELPPPLQRVNWRHTLYFGALCRAVLGRLASPSLTMEWCLSAINERAASPIALDLPDPWLYRSSSENFKPTPWFEPEYAVDAVIGACVIAAMTSRPESGDDAERTGRELREIVNSGVARGMWVYKYYLRNQKDHYDKLIQKFNRAFPNPFESRPPD